MSATITIGKSNSAELVHINDVNKPQLVNGSLYFEDIQSIANLQTVVGMQNGGLR